MNMNKALQNLYHAVSNETTTKVNISKLLVDIHYAITGKESENKNNWSKIVNSMADNWPEGGGGSSDFSTAQVTVNGVGPFIAEVANITEDATHGSVLKSPLETSFIVILYKGVAILDAETPFEIPPSETNIYYDVDNGYYIITGDCTITIS